MERKGYSKFLHQQRIRRFGAKVGDCLKSLDKTFRNSVGDASLNSAVSSGYY
jgi:hypothetical protein